MNDPVCSGNDHGDASQIVWLGLARKDCADARDFYKAVESLRAQLDAAVPGMGAWCRMEEGLTKGTPHGAALAKGPKPFEAIVGLISDAPQLFEQVEEAAGQLDPDGLEAIDTARSGVIAGRCYVVLKAGGQFFSAYWIRPPRGRSIPDCQAYWYETHGVGARDFLVEHAGAVVSGYEQIHSNVDASERVARALGFAQYDFIGSLRAPCDSPELVRAMLKSDHVVEVALADERNFVDHDRSSMALYGPTQFYRQTMSMEKA